MDESIKIRPLTPPELQEALKLVWDVFMQFEAPDYSEEGIETFRAFIHNERAVAALKLYGAFEGDNIVGAAATRNEGRHIALLFVDSRHHRRGIARSLFEEIVRNAPSGRLTVNSSPYAATIYGRLGFTATGEEKTENGIRYIPMVYTKS